MTFRSRKLYNTALSTAMLIGCFSVSVAYGATPLKEMSNTVESLCPALKRANASNPNALNVAQKDVLSRCGELKLAPGQNFSNLSGSQLNGLENMTNDESSSMGTATVELSGAQSVAILGRLTVLRGKTTGTTASYNGSSRINNEIEPEVAKSAESPSTRIAMGGKTGEISEHSLNENLDGYEGNFSQMSEYGKWGFFLNGTYGTGDKDRTIREPGFDFDSWSLVSGVDYRVTDQLVLGGALSYATTDSKVDNNGGNVDLSGVGASLYGTYYVGEFYVDFLAGFAGKEFETQRNVQYSVAAKGGGTTFVDQAFTGKTDAADVNLSVGGGYNLLYGGFSVTPYAQLAYLNSDIDGYSENLQSNNTNPGFGLALSVDDQEVKSLATTLGFQLARTINTSKGVVTPYLRLDWEHEFENDARDITAHFANISGNTLNTILIPTDDPDRDFFNFGAGVATVLAGGYQLFFDYSTVFDYDNISVHSFVGGLRIEF